MLSRNHPDRIRVVFDDHRLVANAGLLLPEPALARHLGLPELVQQRLDRTGRCPGAGERGRQDDDAGGLRAGWGRLH